jgi:hypothetical protein
MRRRRAGRARRHYLGRGGRARDVVMRAAEVAVLGVLVLVLLVLARLVIVEPIRIGAIISVSIIISVRIIIT